MSKLIRVSLTLVIAASAVGAASAETTASRVFAISSPSVVVVKAIDSSGKIVAQGSGVTIAKGIIVSNCHVFEDESTATASVFYRSKRYPARLRYADVAHDLCSFTVTNLVAPPIRMRDAVNLKVGEDAFAIGAPEGFDLTLSNGIVSSLRKTPDGTVIQTTAPISPGSSGGGLFDSEGRLIGITSYYAKEGQQINFALPVEWVTALPQHGKTREQLVSQPPDVQEDARNGFEAYLRGDYVSAATIFRRQAERGDALAQARLGVMYHDALGVPKDDRQSVYWLSQAAGKGNAIAQNLLGAAYATGQGVPQNYALAVGWYRKAAVQGLVDAQYNLARMFYFGQGTPQDYAQSAHWYHEAATQGLAIAQYELGVTYANGEGVPRNDSTAAYWFGAAAEQGYASAQYNLGAMYANGQSLPQDSVHAATWFILAKAAGSKEARDALPRIEKQMTPSQIAKAQRLARDWWAAHHKQ